VQGIYHEGIPNHSRRLPEERSSERCLPSSLPCIQAIRPSLLPREDLIYGNRYACAQVKRLRNTAMTTE